jgi:penicillin-binding protein 2
MGNQSRYFLEGEKPIPDGRQRGPEPQPRVVGVWLVVLATFAVFGLRIAWLQTIDGALYREQAERNRLKRVPIAAPRGVFYDRNGTLLVRNEPAFDVVVVPAQLPDGESRRHAVFARLANLIDLPVSAASAASMPGEASEPGIVEIVADAERRAPFQPVVLKADIPRDVAFAVAESRVSLPGVSIVVHAQRNYPEPALRGDLIGYSARIPEELAADYAADTGFAYDPATDRVGLTGLEAIYEALLRGQKGYREVETDVAGQVLRTVGQPVAPVPGDNVVLTIDLPLQRAARAALEKGLAAAAEGLGHEVRQGVVVALDPRSGAVLAMVSLPDYDNNDFAGGITLREWQRLNADPYTPLINHAVTGQYPPGSTFKLVPAAAALQEGVVQPTTELFDPGVVYLPNRYAPNDPGRAQRFVCWLLSGHAWQNVVEAIANSCDVYFYKVGGGFPDEKLEGLGDRRLADYARAFGFGAPTGIQLPVEAPGLVPDNYWKRRTYAENWSTGDTYNFAIGQGFLTVTPLQLVNMVATVANGGSLYRPYVVDRVVAPDGSLRAATQPEVIREVPVSSENLAIVRQGMREAVTSGTAHFIAWPQGVAVAGKTGTAEFCDDIAQKLELCVNGRVLPTHAWFVAFAPYENPEIAIAVFLYNGGEGSTFAAPVAAEILSAYFDAPLVEPVPTTAPAPAAAPVPATPAPAPPEPAVTPEPAATVDPAATPAPPAP